MARKSTLQQTQPVVHAKAMKKKADVGDQQKTKRRKISDDDNGGGNSVDRKPRDEQWSKSKKKRMRALKSQRSHPKQQPTTATDHSVGKVAMTADQVSKNISAKSANNHGATEQLPSSLSSTRKQTGHQDGSTNLKAEPALSFSSNLQKSFQERLSGSRFRILNEELYTTSSFEAFARFQNDPSLFDEYHEGFRHQVEQWPANPVTILVQKVKKLIRSPSTGKGGKRESPLVVADFGCGDATLAQQLLAVRDDQTKRCPFQVHSFDLVARGPNAELITACDVANTPLEKECVDVGIFCLALMGTNLSDFIREAHRVLKSTGRLHIAEVRSRFEQSNRASKKRKKDNAASGEVDDLRSFINVLDELGFETIQTDRSNTMFVLLELRKNGKTPKEDLTYTAKPCIYKRR